MTVLRVVAAGAVGSRGFGVDAFVRALKGDDFPRDSGHASSGWAARKYGVALVEDLEGMSRQWLPTTATRRADRVSILALLAATDALQRAGEAGPLGEGTALVLATTHGAIGFSADYHQEIVALGAKGLSALLFSSSLLSSPAAAVALHLGIGGPVHTLTSGATAASDVFELSALLLQSGEAERVLAIGAEMFHSLYLGAYDALFRLHARFGRRADPVRSFGFTEGAVALLVDRGDTGGAGFVTGASGTQLGPGWREPLAARLGEAWRRAGWSGGAEDPLLLGANHSFIDRLEKEAVAAQGGASAGVAMPALKTRTGEGFAYTSLLQVLAGLSLLRLGQRALVQGVHFDGAVGAVALRGAG